MIPSIRSQGEDYKVVVKKVTQHAGSGTYGDVSATPPCKKVLFFISFVSRKKSLIIWDNLYAEN